MRKEREDHDLLIKTAQNLTLLQEKSEKDTVKIVKNINIFFIYFIIFPSS